MKRISKDDYYLAIAHATALRSTCLDKQVGCVLVDEAGIILSTGYNGAPRGTQNCTDLNECNMERMGAKPWCKAAHAEQNALLIAGYNRAYAAYCTLEPCTMCTSLLINAGVRIITFANKTTHSGEWLWREAHDSATWRYRPKRISN